MRAVFSRSLTVAAAAAALLALTSCGTPPWEKDAPGAHPQATATTTKTITPVVNDLAAGSVKHTLTAGDIALAVTYWSDLPSDKWTAGANKPLSISAVATLGSDQGQSVYLAKVTLATTVTGGGTTLTPIAPLSDPASVQPGYLLKTPYSYSQTFILPALDKRATSISLAIDYDLLLQSTPTSGAYAKQAAGDHLTIAIAR